MVDGLTGWTGGRAKNPVGFVNNGSSVWITIDGDVSEMSMGSIVVVAANRVFTISTTDPNVPPPPPPGPTNAADAEYVSSSSFYNKSGPDTLFISDGLASYMTASGDSAAAPAYSANSITGSRTVGAGGEAISNDGGMPVMLLIGTDYIVLQPFESVVLESGITFTVEPYSPPIE